MRAGKNDSGEETIKNIIKQVQSLFKGYFRRKVEDRIKIGCDIRGIQHLGQTINRINQLAAANGQQMHC